MKVAIVMSRLANGGLERVQCNLARGFHARGIETIVATGRVLHRYPGDFPDEVRVEEIANGRWGFPVGLYRFLRRERPHCVFTTSNDIACLAALLKRWRFPRMRVITTHHLSLSGPLDQSRGLQRAKLELVLALMRATLPMADGHVAVTHQVAADLSARTVLALDRIAVIHNPIVGGRVPDPAATTVPALPWVEDGSPIVAFAGRLAPEKRLDLLLDAFRELSRVRSVRLLILGDGPLRGDVERRIAAEGFASRCALIGQVDNVFPFIGLADVLVLPSDYEGFGNVLVEAMACGVQVVATDCPHGPREILADGRYGQLVPMGNAIDLRDAIERSLSGTFRIDPERLRARAGEFGIDRAVEAYLAIATATSAPPG